MSDAVTVWYVSGPHTQRAIGYLGATLAEQGDLRPGFTQPDLLALWATALAATGEAGDRSPVDARTFLGPAVSDGLGGAVSTGPAAGPPEPAR